MNPSTGNNADAMTPNVPTSEQHQPARSEYVTGNLADVDKLTSKDPLFKLLKPTVYRPKGKPKSTTGVDGNGPWEQLNLAEALDRL